MKKIAIITGSSSGIGRQIAIDLSTQDYECILLGRDQKKLNETQSLCKDSTYFILNLQDPKSIEVTAEKILQQFSSTHDQHIVLVNNAGIVERSSFLETSQDSWHLQFQTNLFGPVQLTKKLIPLLARQKSARIINISSNLGLKPIALTSAYSASKAAMNSWTQSLALELAPSNILVSAVCPGIIETPLQSFYQTQDQDLRSTINALQPLGRIGQPKDVSQLVQFLAHPDNSWITGALIPIDGGILLGGS